MTKFQFLLISALVTAVVFLFVGSREGAMDTVLPLAAIVAVTSILNRYLPIALWEKFAQWANRITGRKLFYVRRKPQLRLPPSKARRIP